jgi:hypothetical protein
MLDRNIVLSPEAGVNVKNRHIVSIHLRAAGCHCEEPGDEAISHFTQSNQGDCFASLAMTNWWFSPSPARVNGYVILPCCEFECVALEPAYVALYGPDG